MHTKERETKTGQLKQKNKVLDTTKANFEKLSSEHETMKSNFLIKTKKLEKKLENLSCELEQKNKELKYEKKKRH